MQNNQELEKTFVTHTCKNSKLQPNHADYCDRAFVDVDKHRTTTIPPSWKYCPNCISKGFKNPRTRQSSPPSEKQLQARAKFVELVKSKSLAKKGQNLDV